MELKTFDAEASSLSENGIAVLLLSSFPKSLPALLDSLIFSIKKLSILFQFALVFLADVHLLFISLIV